MGEKPVHLNVVTNDRKERRLAAILAADVAGYSRLVGADELGTLARLKAHWDCLFEPKIRNYHGRIVKTTGDGMLVEFASVVNAVLCAAELQRGDGRTQYRYASRQADGVPHWDKCRRHHH